MAGVTEFELPIPVRRTNPGPVDFLYTPLGGPTGYANVQQVLDLIPRALRYDGLTVKMATGGEMFWEQANLEDSGLKEKYPSYTDVKAILVVKANRQRIYYTGEGTAAHPELDGLRKALAAAEPGDTVQQITDCTLSAVGEQIRLPRHVNYDSNGFKLDSANTAVDGITLLGGTGKIFGRHTTVYNNAPTSWGFGWYNNNIDTDYQVYDLHITTSYSGVGRKPEWALVFNVGNLVHTGNITANTRLPAISIGALAFNYQPGQVANYDHTGRVSVSGQTGAFRVEAVGRVTQRGDVTVSDVGSYAGLLLNGGVLEMCGGILDLRSTDARGGFWLNKGGTLILTDVTVLGNPAAVAMQSGQQDGAKLILRGETTLPAGFTSDDFDIEIEVYDQRPKSPTLLINAFETTQLGIIDLKTSGNNYAVDLATRIGVNSVSLLPNDANFQRGVDGSGPFFSYGGWSMVNGVAHADDGATLVCSYYINDYIGDVTLKFQIANLTSGTLAINDNFGFVSTGSFDSDGVYTVTCNVPYYGTTWYLYIYAYQSPLTCDLYFFDILKESPGPSFAGDRIIQIDQDGFRNPFGVTADGNKVDLSMFVGSYNNQNIDAFKVFTQLPYVQGTPSSPDHAVNKAYVDQVAGGAIQITYAALKQKRDYGQLSPMAWYIINDWQLTHNIPYTSEKWTSYTEQIVVQASSPYTISTGPGYSLNYPNDIIYYTLDNDSRMPGATKGFIHRRYDTLQNNDMDIDFRNVRFRRWYENRPGEYNEYSGASTSAYLSATDNGSGNYMDRQMFGNYPAVRNNVWRNFQRTFSQSIFDRLNVVMGPSFARVCDTIINLSTFVNVTLEVGWLIRLDLRASNINGFKMPGTRFYDFFGGVILGSNISNFENRSNNLDFVMLYTNIDGWGNPGSRDKQMGQNTIMQGQFLNSLLVSSPNSTVVTFGSNAEYVPLTTGTFTVDVVNRAVGRVVTVYLGPSCTAPVLDPTVFQMKGTFVAGKNHEYMFKVGSNGFIQGAITLLD